MKDFKTQPLPFLFKNYYSLTGAGNVITFLVAFDNDVKFFCHGFTPCSILHPCIVTDKLQ